jgi:hypothetical protein
MLLTLLLGAALAAPASVSTAAITAAPSAAGTPSASAGQGLRGDYYRSSNGTALDFATYTGTSIDSSLYVDDLLPALRTSAGSTDNVAVRWTGQLEVPADGTYTFFIKGDNGFRMSLDGSSVIDHWTTDWDVQTMSQPLTLTAGPHRLAFDYNQGVGGAYLHTEWSGPGFARQPLPDAALRLPAGFTQADASATIDPAGTKATIQLDAPVTQLPSDAAKHLAVVSGGVVWTGEVAKDPLDASRLVVTSKTPISLNAPVRVSYDGYGGIMTSNGDLKVFTVAAKNDSRWYFATKWAADVSPTNALPDYPRPQLTRKNWLNLNGTWQFQSTEQDAALPTGPLSDRILVPYPMESALSGVAAHHDWSLYQRSFKVPRSWQAGSHERLRLNFGAVDYEAWVYVNGKQVAHHTGGYEAFSADITDAVTRHGPQNLLIKVRDTTDGNSYAVGKQTPTPGGIWYTSTSGIWQTVWLEPVPTAAVDSLVLTPDLKSDSLAVTVRPAAGTSPAARVTATAYAGHKAVGTVSGKAGDTLRLAIANPRLWSPDDPFLYDLKVQLSDGRSKDSVGSYFGMRSVEVAKVGGASKIELNGRPTFLLATLDQGFWPDGLYTAPTDAALRSDLEQQKSLGFNTVRKHIKIEPARWYYWADRLGLMVWQDMPSRNPGAPSTPETDKAFTDQVHTIVDQHISSPSIVMWTMMNEGWGETSRTATGELATAVKQQDPSRLVDAHSGVNCCASQGDSGMGDLIDYHDYHGPASPTPDGTRAAADGEHGGYSLTVPGHIANVSGGQNYGDVPDSEALTEAYVANTRMLIPGAAGSLSGSVYTQITDVEGELNGLLTYDRAVLKPDPVRVRDINRQVIAAGAAAGRTGAQP